MFNYIIWLCHEYIALILASFNMIDEDGNPRALHTVSKIGPSPPGWVYVQLYYLTLSRIYIAPTSTWASRRNLEDSGGKRTLVIPRMMPWVFVQLWYYLTSSHLMLILASARLPPPVWVYVQLYFLASSHLMFSTCQTTKGCSSPAWGGSACVSIYSIILFIVPDVLYLSDCHTQVVSLHPYLLTQGEYMFSYVIWLVSQLMLLYLPDRHTQVAHLIRVTSKSEYMFNFDFVAPDDVALLARPPHPGSAAASVPSHPGEHV